MPAVAKVRAVFKAESFSYVRKWNCLVYKQLNERMLDMCRDVLLSTGPMQVLVRKCLKEGAMCAKLCLKSYLG